MKIEYDIEQLEEDIVKSFSKNIKDNVQSITLGEYYDIIHYLDITLRPILENTGNYLLSIDNKGVIK